MGCKINLIISSSTRIINFINVNTAHAQAAIQGMGQSCDTTRVVFKLCVNCRKSPEEGAVHTNLIMLILQIVETSWHFSKKSSLSLCTRHNPFSWLWFAFQGTFGCSKDMLGVQVSPWGRHPRVNHLTHPELGGLDLMGYMGNPMVHLHQNGALTEIKVTWPVAHNLGWARWGYPRSEVCPFSFFWPYFGQEFTHCTDLTQYDQHQINNCTVRKILSL